MPLPRHVYLLRGNAYECIVSEVLRSPTRETGGLLVGRMVTTEQDRLLLIVAASGPGNYAERDAGSYAPDVLAHQQALEYWCAYYASLGVDYVGEWHSHPPGDWQLSTGDLGQVAEMLADESYYLPDGVYTPIVTVETTGVRLQSWYCPRETGLPKLVPWSLIEAPQDIIPVPPDEQSDAANNR
jgi:proteasome lid subunit RPN8/RPN11